jgi:hypothetical protein
MIRMLSLALVAGCISEPMPPSPEPEPYPPWIELTVAGSSKALAIVGCHTSDRGCDGGDLAMSITVNGTTHDVPAVLGGMKLTKPDWTQITGWALYDHRLDIPGDGVTEVVVSYDDQIVEIQHVGLALVGSEPVAPNYAATLTYDQVPAPGSSWATMTMQCGDRENYFDVGSPDGTIEIPLLIYSEIFGVASGTPCTSTLYALQGMQTSDDEQRIRTEVWAEDTRIFTSASR